MALPKVDETLYENAVALAEQRAARIEALEAALRNIIVAGSYQPFVAHPAVMVDIARAALDKDAT